MQMIETRPETRTEKLDLRLTKSAKRILHSAAQAERRSVSDFVLESALARAAETLLDAPPKPAPRLAKLLNEPSVFERGRV